MILREFDVSVQAPKARTIFDIQVNLAALNCRGIRFEPKGSGGIIPAKPIFSSLLVIKSNALAASKINGISSKTTGISNYAH